jgi:phage-related minor tail protein
MTEPTNPSGTDIASLKLGVDTSEATTAASDLDKLGTATIKAVQNINELSSAVDKNSDWMARANAGYKNRIQIMQDEWKAEQQALQGERDVQTVREAAIDQASRFIAKLEEMVATFGMTKTELLSYKAAQLNVTEQTKDLIATLEQLQKTEMQNNIQQKRDIELYNEQSQAILKQVAIQQQRDLEIHNLRQKDFLDYVAFWEKQLALQDASDASILEAEKATSAKRIEIQQRRDVEMNALRQKETVEYVEFWERQLAIQEAAAKREIAIAQERDVWLYNQRSKAHQDYIGWWEQEIVAAEKRAMADINWSAKSLKARIDDLNKLKSYQESNQISQGTLQSLFPQSAFDQLPNLGRLTEEYNTTLSHTHRAQQEVTESAGALSQAYGNNRVRTEAIVIAHEALQGRFTRIPGSIMVMVEYLNAAAVSFTGLGLGIIAAAAGIGLLTYEMVKGQNQTKEFNNSIIRTNGYAGETRDSLEALAHTVGSLHGNYTEAYQAAAQLTASGKFTAEQISNITQSVVELEHAFGTKLNVSIKEFESLSVKGTSVAAASTFQVSKALEKLDEQYHFVTVSLMEEILQLEKEGKAREASELAVKSYADETKRAAEKSIEYIGWIEKSWNAVTRASKGVLQSMADIGKKETDSFREQNLLLKLDKNKDGSLVTDESQMSPKGLAFYKDYIALEKELDDANQKAIQTAKETEARSNANHQLVLREIEDKKLLKKSQGELQDALAKSRAEDDVIEAGDPGYKLKNAQLILDREAAITKLHTEKVRAIKNDGRKQILLDNLASSKAEYDQAKEAADATEKMLKEWADNGLITRQTEYNSIGAARKDQLEKLQIEKEEELKTLDKYQALGKVDAATTIKRINDVARSYELAALKIKDATELSQQKVIDKAVTDVTKDSDKEIKQLDDKIQKQRLLNLEVGKNAAQKEEAKKQLDDESLANEQLAAILYDIKIKTEDLGTVEKAVTQAQLKKTEEIILKRQQYNDLLKEGVALEEQAALQKEIDRQYTQFNRKLSEDLASAIVDGGGRGVKKLIRDMEIAFAKAILQPILQPITSAVSDFLYPTATQAGGVAGASGAGGVGGAIGLANAATNAYKMLTNGFDGVSSMVANITQRGINLAQGQGYSPYVSTNGAFASGVGQVASSVGGYFAGNALNSTISGQYQTGSGIMTVEKIATAVGSYFGPQFGAIVGAVSGLVNRAFGMGPKNVTTMGLRGTLSDSGVTGDTYSNWHQDGGWFRSDKNGTDTKPVTEDVVNSFTSGLAQMKVQSADFAKVLGINSEALKDYSKTFDITLTGDATKDASAITAFFSTVGDDIANKLIPNLSEFSRSGETASATLQRLSDTFTATNAIADLLGKNVEQVFGAVGLASDAARERIVDLAGGIQNLSAYTTSFNKNYLSEAEKLVPAQKAVTAAMKELGLSNINTKQDFKDLVFGLDLSSQAGAEMFVNLMKIQESFSLVADAAQALTDATNKQVEADKTALEAANKNLLDAAMKDVDQSFQRLTKSVTAEKDRLNKAYSDETKAIKDNAEALKTEAQTRLKTAQDSLTAISKVYDQLTSALKSTQIDSPAMDIARRKEAQKYLSNASSNQDLTTATGLQDALTAVAKPSQQMFATFNEYALDQAKTVNAIVTLQENAQVQKDYAQLTVDGISATIAAITSSSEAQLEALQIQHDADIAAQDKVLEKAQTQIDLLNKLDNTLLSVRDALALFSGSVAGAKATESVVNGGSAPNAINDLYKSLLGREGDLPGLTFWNNAYMGGQSLTDIAKNFTSSDEYKGLHPFDEGTNYIPNDMPAYLHEGEAVIPKADNKALMSAVQNKNSGNDALLVEVKGLRQEVASLRAENQAANSAIERNSNELTRLARRWEGNGIPIRSDATTPVHVVTP